MTRFTKLDAEGNPATNDTEVKPHPLTSDQADELLDLDGVFGHLVPYVKAIADGRHTVIETAELERLRADAQDPRGRIGGVLSYHTSGHNKGAGRQWALMVTGVSANCLSARLSKPILRRARLSTRCNPWVID